MVVIVLVRVVFKYRPRGVRLCRSCAEFGKLLGRGVARVDGSRRTLRSKTREQWRSARDFQRNRRPERAVDNGQLS